VWDISGRWATALTESHEVVTKVEAWWDGQRRGVVDISSGTVTIRARNRVRRDLDLYVAEDLWPTSETSLLSPYGAELRVWAGISYGPGDVELVPVFRGRVATVERTTLSGQLHITAMDRFADINDAGFETTRAAPAGARLTDAIRSLIGEVLPDATVTDLTAATATVPAGLVWDRDRGSAIDDLAKAIGAEVVCGPEGGFTIQPVPALSDTPVWALAEGVNVVADVPVQSRVGAANAVVVTAERADGGPPIRVVVRDDNPASPTRRDGPFGKVTRYYSSALITDEGQAAQAGSAVLTRALGITRQRTITTVPNPALDAGDTIVATVGGVRELHIADVITLPLGHDGAMTVQTRSTDVADLT
jgi:hypothetical protein